MGYKIGFNHACVIKICPVTPKVDNSIFDLVFPGNAGIHSKIANKRHERRKVTVVKYALLYM